MELQKKMNTDVFKQLVLEAENLLDRVEEDTNCNIRWICEKETLVDTIKKARRLLWPKKEQQLKS